MAAGSTEMDWLARADMARPALYDAETRRWYSWREMQEKTTAFAARLPGAKSLMFCFLRNNIDSVVAYLAALQGNHSVALLDENLDATAKQQLISAYSPDFVLDESITEAILPDYVNSGGLWQSRNEGIQPRPHPDLALLLPTSGTTGSPKFVRLSYDNVRANASSIVHALSIDPDHRAITSLPLFYSFGLSVLNTHLLGGGSLVLTGENLMMAGFWSLFREQNCNSLAGVPYTFEILKRLGLERLNIPELRLLAQAGGRLSNQLVMDFDRTMRKLGGRFFVMYGQTEATARMTVLPPEQLPDKLGSVGLPVEGGRIRILAPQIGVAPAGTDSEQTGDLPAGTVGEVVYTGPNVMMGYAHNRDDLASGDVNHGVLRTGDLGYLDPDGFLFITGRASRFAKLCGYRVNLDEVEQWLGRLGRVAVVSNDAKLLICTEQAADFDLVGEVSARLKLHPSIIEVRVLECLPLTGNNKTNYRALQELI